jgi:hypothetical protein
MNERQQLSPHPLDDCDEGDCYKTMMAERTVLIAAQRDAQDNLIKTIIQLSSALIALMAGFSTQSKLSFSALSSSVFSISLASLGIAIVSGLTENFYSSKAYSEQQKILEDYYSKYISEFREARSNKLVRRAQLCAFTFFVIALLCLAIFGIIEAKGKSDVKKSTFSPATSTITAPASSRSI